MKNSLSPQELQEKREENSQNIIAEITHRVDESIEKARYRLNNKQVKECTARSDSQSPRKTFCISQIEQEEDGGQEFGHGAGNGIQCSSLDPRREPSPQIIGSNLKAMGRAPDDQATDGNIDQRRSHSRLPFHMVYNMHDLVVQEVVFILTEKPLKKAVDSIF